MIRNDDRTVRERRGAGGARAERGSALVLAVLIMAILSLMGLAFSLTADMEGKISVNSRQSSQALYVAEGTAWLVKSWFEDPTAASGWLVPTTSQVNRTLRWVDHDNDGTFQAYSTAPAPWNVVYRNGTNDLFERPYRGNPALSLQGSEDHPDVRISVTGSSNEQSFLTSLNNALYPSFPAPMTRARILQIDVFGPPVIDIAGQKVRYGIGSVVVRAGIFEAAGTAAERQVSERLVRAVINEVPYVGPAGPLQSCTRLEVNGNFEAHWGKVTAGTTLDLPASIDNKVDSSVPWYDRNRYITRDMNLDGTLSPLVSGTATPDDQDGNGQYDFDEWVATGPALEDPWLRMWAQGDILRGGLALTPGCGSADCQPMPWFQSPSTLTNTNDHSNMAKNVTQETCPNFNYNFWKTLASSGLPNLNYYSWDPGVSAYRRNGTGAPSTFIEATNGKNGLFFFDTTDGLAPHDDNGDGTAENFPPLIQISGMSYQAQGLIYLNGNLKTTGSGSAPGNLIMPAPAEPWVDANASGTFDTGDYFVDLTYPANPSGSTWTKSGMLQEGVTGTRQDPSVDAAAAGKYALPINFYGVFYVAGQYDAAGDWIYFGSVVTQEGVANSLTGTPRLYFDERMIKGTWPPPSLKLPRTMITRWETDM